MSVFVYKLTDPVSGCVRYVGCTADAEARLKAHLCEAAETLKRTWFEYLERQGLLPIMEVLEVVPCDSIQDELARKREGFWFRHFEALGEPLLNQKDPETGSYLGREREKILKGVA